MHTDEYEISLGRELYLCKKSIARLQKFLFSMERKYNMGTAAFIEDFNNGKLSDRNEDFKAWLDNYTILKSWEKRNKEFEEIFLRMKIC